MKRWWIYAPFLFSQAALIAVCCRILSRNAPAWIAPAAALLVLFSIAADLLLIRKASALAERALSKEREQLLRAQLELQRQHHERLESDVNAAQAIRLSIASELAEAYALLKSHPAQARRQLDGVTASLTREGARFCEHPVADALLSAKASECAAHGIAFTHALELPAALPLDSVTLCAALGNVLDNAIQASLACPDGARAIELRAHAAGGYFILKAENRALPPKIREAGNRLSLHGWGLPILRQIARRHDGALEADYRDGRFYATLWLKV